MRKFSARFKWWTCRTTIGMLCLYKNVPILMKSKQSIHIMVFGVVTCNGDIMPPFIFPHDHTLNMEVYIKNLKEVVLPWIKRVAAAKPYDWQQDCAMPHKQENLVLENFSNHITLSVWSPNSPDCNPLDYYVDWRWERDQQNCATPKVNWRQG